MKLWVVFKIVAVILSFVISESNGLLVKKLLKSLFQSRRLVFIPVPVAYKNQGPFGESSFSWHHKDIFQPPLPPFPDYFGPPPPPPPFYDDIGFPYPGK